MIEQPQDDEGPERVKVLLVDDRADDLNEIVVDVVDEEAARLVVRDHGEGIPREQMPLLIVEAHGGAIKVSSEPGRGTTFTVELPTGSTEGQPSQ